MKNFLLALVAFLGLSGAAFASDLPRRSAPVAPAPVAVSAPLFTGFYAGVVGGYRWDVIRSNDATGALGGSAIGLTAGYNHRVGNIVVGVEGDVSLGRRDDSAFHDARQYGTVRARAGYAFGNLLPYVTAGYAGARFAGFDGVSHGFAYGAGAEFAISGPWSIKGEWIRMDVDAPVERYRSDVVRGGVNYRF